MGEKPETGQENEKRNPNSIGELISLGKDLETQPDKVYRSVGTREAITDIENSGVVRNKQSAGLVDKSRWGDRVFWSKGDEGRYHSVPRNGYVIEAPLSVAQERVVTKDDVTAIYTKNEEGEVVNVLQLKQKIEDSGERVAADEREVRDQERLEQLREELSLDKND